MGVTHVALYNTLQLNAAFIHKLLSNVRHLFVKLFSESHVVCTFHPGILQLTACIRAQAVAKRGYDPTAVYHRKTSAQIPQLISHKSQLFSLMSFRKERTCTVTTSKVQRASAQNFEEELGVLVGVFLKVPIGEENVLKFEVVGPPELSSDRCRHHLYSQWRSSWNRT
jgi:hypothetical protein